MNCENRFCIYEAHGNCTLKSVHINSLGMCAECICADIDEEILDQAKSKLLQQYEAHDSSY